MALASAAASGSGDHARGDGWAWHHVDRRLHLEDRWRLVAGPAAEKPGRSPARRLIAIPKARALAASGRGCELLPQPARRAAVAAALSVPVLIPRTGRMTGPR